MARSKQRLKSTSKSRKTRVATEDDIDMLLELAELYNTNYDFEAAEWFWGEYNREVTLFEEFRNKYPQGSKGAQLFERFTSKFELAGILIEYRFLNENLYFYSYGAVQTEWEGTNSVIYCIMNEWNDPRFRENFELLARKGIKWLENHPPKIKEE